MLYRGSYPDRKEGEDDGTDKELPDEKTLEYDDETLELMLPSGEQTGLLDMTSVNQWNHFLNG